MDQIYKSYQARRVSFPAKKKQSNLNERVCLIEGFSLVTGLQELLELIVEQSNLYAHQNGRNCTVTKEELKPFIGINFVVAINKLPTIAEYWWADNLIGNDVIQNLTIWNLFLWDLSKSTFCR